MIKHLAILGSTGSIGVQALEVCANLEITVDALVAGSNINLLEKQIRQFKPKMVVVSNESGAKLLKIAVHDTMTKVYGGSNAILEAVTMPETDMVLTAVVGSAGLVPTVSAMQAGKDIALANKETLVAAGSIIMPLAEKMKVHIYPVDSEHSAIFQSLAGNRSEDVEKLVLTASGGPFRGYTEEMFYSITKEQALKHPNWSMGNKITIDSATMMNKGLEVIEAHWLFHIPVDSIEVLVHPQSIIHSMVSYKDGSIMAQLGAPDMRVPIQLAFTWPDRQANPFKRVSFAEIQTLTFEQVNREVFRCLDIAYKAVHTGGTVPAVMNAANEIAVALFLQDRIKFTQIPEIVERVIQQHQPVMQPSLEAIEWADKEARIFAEAMVH